MNIQIRKEQIQEIRIEDKNYPEKLRHIYCPPKILYVLGNAKILNTTSIAIIGCRDCSEYGKKISNYFAKELARKNITIISGLARGIDTYAHQGTLLMENRQNNCCIRMWVRHNISTRKY